MKIWNSVKETVHEYWETLLIQIPRITLSIIVVAIFVLIAIAVSRSWNRIARHRNPENQLVIQYIVKLVKGIIILCGVILGLHMVGFSGVAGGLMAGAGVGALVLGFAFKNIGENFIAGVLLVFDRPFDIGDTVTIGGIMGKVVMLKFRTTHLKTFEGKDVYIPNGTVVNTEVFNHTQDGYLRHEFVIGIDYNNSIEEAVGLIKTTIHQHPEVMQEEETQILVDEFGTNTVNLKVMFWTDTLDFKVKANVVKSELMVAVKNALMNAGFGLPANIQELKMYDQNPLNIDYKKNLD